MKNIAKAHVYIDSEWGSKGQVICTQALIVSKTGGRVKYIIFNQSYRELLESKGVLPGMNAILKFEEFRDDRDVLTPLAKEHLVKTHGPNIGKEISCNLYLFYSAKDIWIPIGFDNFEEFINTPRKDQGFQIEQKRNLKGSFVMTHEESTRFRFKIKDVSGWTNSGLIKLANSLGLSVAESIKVTWRSV